MIRDERTWPDDLNFSPGEEPNGGGGGGSTPATRAVAAEPAFAGAAATLALPLVSGEVLLDVVEVAVATARSEMPRLMQLSAETGRGYLIRNARSARGVTALLIDPKVLQQKLTQARPRRTLGEVLELLPFREGNPHVRLMEHPDNVPVRLRIGGLAPALDPVPSPQGSAR